MSTRDELAAWTTRDDLITDLSENVPAAEWDMANELGDVSGMADALFAEGWRKKPSEAELEDVIQRHWEGWTGRESQDFCTIVAASVLALMDRGQ